MNHETPLSSPHAEFHKTRSRAAGGVALEERNLAAFYESGYLVSPCEEKAAYWYHKAAQHGDQIAKAWVDRNASMQRLRYGGECFGDACFGSSKAGVQRTVLQMGTRNTISALITINGKTVRGIIDTGASFVSMGAKTAQELGITYAGGRPFQSTTANGVIVNRAVMLKTVSVGNVELNDVEGAVSETDHPLLIGMSFLKRLNISTNGGAMTLTKP